MIWSLNERERVAAEEVCQSVYAEVADYYASKMLRVDGEDLGYSILYSPPIPRADILFMGYQPGGGVDRSDVMAAEEQRRGWPESYQYATTTWRLAKRMQEIWCVETLSRSVGLNMIFFRAPSMAKWRQVDSRLRRESEELCREWTERIVRALKPQQIVMIGFRTFETLTDGAVALTSERPAQARTRVLVKRGELWEIPAFGVIHLTGARIHLADKARIKSDFAGPCSS